MRIAAVAKMVGVSPRAIRHYHRVGALPEPDRQINGYRDYDLGDIVRLLHVRRLVASGVALRSISALPELQGESLRTEALATRDRLIDERDRIDQQISALDRLLAEFVDHPRAGLERRWATVLSRHPELEPLIERERAAYTAMTLSVDEPAALAEITAQLETAYDVLLAEPGAGPLEALRRFVALEGLDPVIDHDEIEAVSQVLATAFGGHLTGAGADDAESGAREWFDAIIPDAAQQDALRLAARYQGEHR